MKIKALNQSTDVLIWNAMYFFNSLFQKLMDISNEGGIFFPTSFVVWLSWSKAVHLISRILEKSLNIFDVLCDKEGTHRFIVLFYHVLLLWKNIFL